MMLVTNGEATANESYIQIWKGQAGSKGTWWYLELVDDTLQSANLGKADKP
jgi:hypothetical protein